MARFQSSKKNHQVRNTVLSVLLFLGILLMFYSGISSLSSASLREQKNTLETALTQSAVHCYALNGYYPENLEELVGIYGIIYDKDLFFVDYQPQGQNLMPEITVLERE